MLVGSDIPNLVNFGGMEYPVEYPSFNRIIGQRCLKKKNPAIVAFSLVSSWERGVGKIEVINAMTVSLERNMPDGFVSGYITLQPCAMTLFPVLPLHILRSSLGLVQNSFPPTIWS